MTRRTPEEVLQEWNDEVSGEECAAVGYLYPDGWQADPATLVFCANELSDSLQWVPVNEEMPEKDGRYEVWFDGQPDYAKRLGDHWWLHGQKLFGVTHWRKPPEGPKVS